MKMVEVNTRLNLGLELSGEKEIGVWMEIKNPENCFIGFNDSFIGSKGVLIRVNQEDASILELLYCEIKQDSTLSCSNENVDSLVILQNYEKNINNWEIYFTMLLKNWGTDLGIYSEITPFRFIIPAELHQIISVPSIYFYSMLENTLLDSNNNKIQSKEFGKDLSTEMIIRIFFLLFVIIIIKNN